MTFVGNPTSRSSRAHNSLRETTMKFYMTPGSCSTGIHILLEELELVFEVYLVNLMAGDH